jgi:hypothetical protein
VKKREPANAYHIMQPVMQMMPHPLAARALLSIQPFFTMDGISYRCQRILKKNAKHTGYVYFSQWMALVFWQLLQRPMI